MAETSHSTPDQIAVLPVSEKYNDYALRVQRELELSDIRGFVDNRNEKTGRKIHDAEVGKIPFMLIVGEKEVEAESVSPRQRGEGDLGSMSIEDFAQLFKDKVAEELAG